MHAMGNSERGKQDMNRVVKHYWDASECIVLCNVAGGGPSTLDCTDSVSVEVEDVTRKVQYPNHRKNRPSGLGNRPSTCFGPLEKPTGFKLAAGI